jgi:hypothetical protein
LAILKFVGSLTRKVVTLKNRVLVTGVNWGQIFILDLAVFVSSTFRSLPTNVGLSSEVQKVSSSGGASPSTGLPPKRQGKVKNKDLTPFTYLAESCLEK